MALSRSDARNFAFGVVRLFVRRAVDEVAVVHGVLACLAIFAAPGSPAISSEAADASAVIDGATDGLAPESVGSDAERHEVREGAGEFDGGEGRWPR